MLTKADKKQQREKTAELERSGGAIIPFICAQS